MIRSNTPQYTYRAEEIFDIAVGALTRFSGMKKVAVSEVTRSIEGALLNSGFKKEAGSIATVVANAVLFFIL